MSPSAPLEVVELTAAGPGAIRVLRLAGPGALEALRRLAPGIDPPLGRPIVARLVVGGEALDEAVVLRRGAHELELCLTGSGPLVQRVTHELVDEPAPARCAPETLEERALERLALAPCEAAARILLDQAEGALRRALEPLLGLRAAERGAALEVLLERGRIARRALVPTEVALAGPVNAGKSTLFNALLGEERALVSPEPGTTRDWLLAPARLGPWPIALSDVAGERELDAASETGREPSARPDALEAAGQLLARRARERAELVLWLAPCAEGGAGMPRELACDPRVRVVASQADRVPAGRRPAGSLSALVDPEGARAAVLASFRERFRLPESAWNAGEGVPFLEVQIETLSALRGAAPERWASAFGEIGL